MMIRPSRQTGKTRDPSPFGDATHGFAAREILARRSLSACLLQLDDSTLATFGCCRAAIEETGRAPSPL